MRLKHLKRRKKLVMGSLKIHNIILLKTKTNVYLYHIDLFPKDILLNIKYSYRRRKRVAEAGGRPPQ